MSSHDYPPSIEGQGMFDSDPRINPDYWDYNMVFVPYCTSDLWLGVSGVAKGDFLFLGETIFHSVVDELMGRGMNKASEVVLVGSGTGGIGVLNLAGWLQSKLSKETTFSAILDSAWFINYDNNIDNLVGSDGSSRSPWLGLFRSTCGDTETVGYPCCISASCMLTNAAKGQTSRSQTAGFPNISYFVIFSQYDIFLLSNSLQKQSGVKDVKKRQMEWFRTMTEYGGEMKRSLNETARKANNMSYFVTSCLQHIYLRLSNLRRGKRSIHIFDISSDSLQYKSATNPDVWSTLYSVNGSSRKVTIQCAIHEWNQNRKMKRTVRYFDDCQGAGCNPHCPERVELGEMNSLWSSGASLVVDCLVLTATCICLVYKVVMMWRKYMLFKAYRAFINEGKISLETSNMALRRSDAIGVACLDLRYHVHLSHDAIRQVTEIEKGRRAEEDEAQYLLTPYIRSPQSSVDNSGKRLKKQGAVSEVNDNSSVEEVDLGTLRSLGNEQLVSGNDSRQWSSTNGRQNSHDDHKYMYDSKFGTLNVSCDKSIINGISSYFNPKEMVAIMGPSGCGKTTLLDLLTGRRRKGKCEGEIFVNGIPFVYLREWYKKHTGYVLQSAVPFYEEMTVRENLVLAAFLRLPRSLSADERFNRIENIIDQVGLNIVEDTIVGGSTGLGLSGGQKRRLAVAIQLLSLPRVLFLDEPTSGLDATSSMELLQHLQCIACSGRLVVLTIHQPRLEVFHMFDRILLLCQGEVAYYGSPMDAPTLFLKAYQVAKLEGDAPELDHNKNPADVIMDMLSSELGRKAILNYYKMTFERKNVKNAIKQAKRSYSDDELHEDNKQVDSGWMNRLLVLETRASLRMSTSQKLYLPSIFLLLSVVTGNLWLIPFFFCGMHDYRDAY
jgi:ABC-type multidrug transport system ATPase subunit